MHICQLASKYLVPEALIDRRRRVSSAALQVASAEALTASVLNYSTTLSTIHCSVKVVLV